MSDKQLESLTWEDIEIETSYSPSDIMGYAHLELRTKNKEKLPVTETGYRSHFLKQGVVEEAGGPTAFVLAWLDMEANDPMWRRQQAAANQLELF